MLALLASVVLLAPPHVPPIGRIFGVRNHVDTIEMLERRIGPGKPFTGGHPLGGRSWQDPTQGWLISTDGFEYAPTGKGRYIEGVQLSAMEGASKLPTIRRRKYGSLDSVRPGMSREQVKRALKSQVGFWKGNAFFQRGQARITHGSNPEVENFHRWIADFSFTNDRLVAIDLRAE